jgi:hypothetical protein
MGNDREEYSAARNISTTIEGHCSTLIFMGFWIREKDETFVVGSASAPLSNSPPYN